MADTDDPFVKTSQPHIYRPIPLRNWSSTSNSNQSSSTNPPFSDPPAAGAAAASTSSAFSPEPQSPPPRQSPSSDFLAQLNARLLRSTTRSSATTTHSSSTSLSNSAFGLQEAWNGDNGTPKREKSFLNMTRGTLFGIYDDEDGATTGANETPWGVGAETPGWERDSNTSYLNGNGIMREGEGLGMKNLRANGVANGAASAVVQKKAWMRTRTGQKQSTKAVAAKLLALFLFGTAYGAIISLLQDSRSLNPSHVHGNTPQQMRWLYFVGWGVAGVILGSLLPVVDFLWEGEDGEKRREEERGRERERLRRGGKEDAVGGQEWNEVVRSLGAFVGIAFAIRKLPWQSTLQLTLTLALVNPALWYILDRSKTGFLVSMLFTSLLTSFILLSNPDVLPSPPLPAVTNHTNMKGSVGVGYAEGEGLFGGLVSYESLAVATWVGSVVFCSCVCFGSVGRRLGVLGWR